MTLPVVWRPEADAELRDAHGWYDAIRPELGERFVRAIENTVEAIADHPLQFPVVYRDRRRAGVWKFPYGVFFEIQEDRIVIIACFHGRRSPKHWQRR